MTDPRRAERAAGQLSTTFGVGVFLTLLMFASHLLLDLWLTSSVLGVARDAAVEVATSEPTDRSAARVRALDTARLALGGMAEDVEMTFEADPAGSAVVLRVRAPSITLLPPGLAPVIGSRGLDRRVVVPVEDPA